MAWSALDTSGISHGASPLESERFGLSIGRVTIGIQADPEEIRARLPRVLGSANEDLLIVRYPAAQVWIGSLLAQAGHQVVPAGALTYWEADAGSVAAHPGPTPEADDLDVVPAAELGGAAEIQAVIDELVADSFAGYGNHYAASPRLLDPEAALAGYRDWARRSVSGAGGALVLRQGGTPIGVATLEHSPDGKDLEILLAGLVSAAQGKGRYGALLTAVDAHATRVGARRVIISTQAHNVRVQRAWVRAGLRPFAAIETAHLTRAAAVSEGGD